MLELEQMKETMDRMEQERAEMVAEVEAQIERALASMAVDFDSDYGGGASRPGSRLSSVAGSRSRRPSDAAGAKHRQLRSFGTESTLAESYDSEDAGVAQATSHNVVSKIREASTIKEVDEEEQPLSPNKKKRFSASDLEGQQDGMNAVDEGISLRSDNIAQKVFEIQQKVSRRRPSQHRLFTNMLSLFTQLESALQSEPRTAPRWKAESEDESSEHARPATARSSSARSRLRNSIKKRSRSGTTSSTQTRTQTDDTAKPTISGLIRNRSGAVPEDNKTPTRGSFSDVDRDETSTTPEPLTQSSSSDASSGVDKGPIPSSHSTKLPAPGIRSATTTGTTDDSDTDFQSAYSASPRGSYGSFENNTKKQPLTVGEDEPEPIDMDEDDLHENWKKNVELNRAYRGRVTSVVSVVNTRDTGNVSLPLSDSTVTAST